MTDQKIYLDTYIHALTVREGKSGDTREGSKRRYPCFLLMFFMLLLFTAPLSAQAAPGEIAEIEGVELDNSRYSQLTVSWTKVSGASGYEIHYSTKKNMKNSKKLLTEGKKKTSARLKGLKCKTVYYVQVRAYRVENGKKDFGGYSKIRHKTVKGKIIAIDAGHQKKANTGSEPIGPGSSSRKMKESGGAQGCITGQPEYQLNLKVALRLQKVLKKRGYTVKMIRTTNDVDISSSRRAKMANRWQADAFVRIHANGSSSSSVKGALTMCPSQKNPFPIVKKYKACRRLAKKILDAMCKETGAQNLGILESDTMSGFNWCEVPVTIVEMGFLSNPSEDRMLAKASYQKKMAAGIANGLDAYFGRK